MYTVHRGKGHSRGTLLLTCTRCSLDSIRRSIRYAFEIFCHPLLTFKRDGRFNFSALYGQVLALDVVHLYSALLGKDLASATSEQPRGASISVYDI